MGVFLVILLIIWVVFYVASRQAKADETQEKKEKEISKKIEKAKFEGKPYYVDGYGSHGEVRVDLETGERYIEKYIWGGHKCKFDVYGHLLRDYTAEQLEKNLGDAKDKAIRDGRRLYMIDNEGNVGQYGYGLQHIGVVYKDLLNGNDYAIYEVRLTTGDCPLLLDLKTFRIYDVLKTNDNREYLEGNLKSKYWIPRDSSYSWRDFFNTDNLKEWLSSYNWAVTNVGKEHVIEFLKSKYGYIHTYNPCDGLDEIRREKDPLNWSNYITLDVRDEFKNVKDYPLVIASENPHVKYRREKESKRCCDKKSVLS